MKSRSIVDINVKGKTMKLVEDNKECLHDLGIKKNVLDNTEETLIIKGNFFK